MKKYHTKNQTIQKIASLERKINNISNSIDNLQMSIASKQKILDRYLKELETNNHLLEYLKAQLPQLKEKKPKKEKKRLTLEDNCQMGLGDRICHNPYAKCCLHNCLISYIQVRNRKCIMKMCKHLEYK